MSRRGAGTGTEPLTGPRARQLAHLRSRMTLIYGVAAAVGLALLALIATTTDSRVRQDRFDEEVHGLALRASVLPSVSDGEVDVEGLVDDTIVDQVTAVMVVAGQGDEVAYQSAAIDGGVELARGVTDGSLDDPDTGSPARTLRVEGAAVRAVAMPYYEGERVAGAVVVAKASPDDPDHRALALAVWLTAAALALGATTVGWVFAGRQVREVGASLDRQEQFLSLAAHELRTPIGRSRAVAESARLLIDTRGDDPDAARLTVAELDRLIAIAQDMSTTVDDLLLLGRIDADQVVTARLRPVRLDEILLPLENDAQGVTVQTPGPVSVMGDPALLRHLVLNLVGNARRHGVSGVDEVPSIEVALEVETAGSPEAVLTIADRGPGFPPELEPVAFDRFVTGGAGTGLGLWIVRWIAGLHGGSVAIADRTGGGALVTVRLPRSAARS